MPKSAKPRRAAALETKTKRGTESKVSGAAGKSKKASTARKRVAVGDKGLEDLKKRRKKRKDGTVVTFTSSPIKKK